MNGKISGLVDTNDGEISTLDFIADNTRIGVMVDGAFSPLLYLDAGNNRLTFVGQMILGDGYAVTGENDIRALDGADGADGAKGDKGDTGATGAAGAGFYTLTLRSGVFPTNALATADFYTAYSRYPTIDDHLTYRNSDGTASSTKRFDGSTWVAPTMLIHGDLLATGSIHGNRIAAGTELTAPKMLGGEAGFGADGPYNGYNTYIHPDGEIETDHLTARGGTLDNMTIRGQLDGATGTFDGTVQAKMVLGSKVLVDSGVYSNVFTNGETVTIETNIQVSAWSTNRTFVATAGTFEAYSTSGTGMWWGFETTVRHATPWNPQTGVARIQIVAKAFMYGNSSMSIHDCNWKLWELI